MLTIYKRVQWRSREVWGGNMVTLIARHGEPPCTAGAIQERGGEEIVVDQNERTMVFLLIRLAPALYFPPTHTRGRQLPRGNWRPQLSPPPLAKTFTLTLNPPKDQISAPPPQKKSKMSKICSCRALHIGLVDTLLQCSFAKDGFRKKLSLTVVIYYQATPATPFSGGKFPKV